jgi:microcystin-dependent protein
MPRNGSGTYSLPQAPFVPGTIISSSAMNSDLSDIAIALTQSISADGQTPITGTLNFVSGTAPLPSLTFIIDDTTGMYLQAVGKLGFSAGGTALLILDSTSSGVSDNTLLYGNGAIPMPVGTVVDFAGSSAPTGWLLCFGQVVAQATYPGLFAICSTTYNTGGEGAGNFRLPDCRGRATVGKDNMGGSAASRITVAGCGIDGTVLGANGGEQTHILVVAELAAHSHTGTTDIEGQVHTHNFTAGFATGACPFGGGNPQCSNAGSTTGNQNQNHTHTFTSGNTGSGTGHNNVQPTIIFNKIIFAGR